MGKPKLHFYKGWVDPEPCKIKTSKRVVPGMDHVKSSVERLLLDRSRRFEDADFTLVSVEANGTFVYKQTILSTGETTTYQAKWKFENGIFTLDFTGQILIQNENKKIKIMKENEQQALYPAGEVCSKLILQEEGLKQLISTIQNKLDAMDSENESYYLQEVFETSFIYEVRGRGQSNQMYRRSYTSTNGVVEFTGEPVEVRQETEFVTMEEKPLVPILWEEEEKRRIAPDGPAPDTSLEDEILERQYEISQPGLYPSGVEIKED